MEICKRCKLAVECGASSESDFCLNYEPRPLTNADRIRSMTDEELAHFMNHDEAGGCPAISMDCQEDCEKCWLDWLKREEQT